MTDYFENYFKILHQKRLHLEIWCKKYEIFGNTALLHHPKTWQKRHDFEKMVLN